MEWVETTSTTVELAKDLLLDRLGVDEEEAEFEVLEEPTTGLFGRKRGQARVRARVMPKSPRAKDDRRRRGNGRNGNKGSGSGSGSARQKPAKAKSDQGAGGRGDAEQSKPPESAPASDTGSPRRSSRPPKSNTPREELPPADAAVIAASLKDFLDGVVTSFGLEGSTTAEVVDGEVHANIEGTGLGFLIGPSGGVIDAVQELARTFSQKESKGSQAPRVKVDVGSYRAGRKTELEAFVRTVAEQVKETGEAVAFEPMGSVDRKTVHDTASEIDGLSTTSEGEDPRRKVVILPA